MTHHLRVLCVLTLVVLPLSLSLAQEKAAPALPR